MSHMRPEKNKAEWIKVEVKKFINSPANILKKWNDEPAWGEPIVGFRKLCPYRFPELECINPS